LSRITHTDDIHLTNRHKGKPDMQQQQQQTRASRLRRGSNG
jgi:hypothetical protein